jgi:hypothetical protein
MQDKRTQPNSIILKQLASIIPQKIQKNYTIVNYAQEYSKTNPLKKNLEFIKETYVHKDSYILTDFTLESTDSTDQNYLLKRYGEYSQGILLFSHTSKPGDIRTKNNNPLSKHTRYNFGNMPKPSITFSSGKTHIAIGFVDLSHFLNFQFTQESNEPFKYIGYDGSLFCVVKTKIIIEMISREMNSESIIQVWFSSGWSKKTKNDFLIALNALLEKESSQEEKKFLYEWKKENIKRSDSQSKWKETHLTGSYLIDTVANLVNEKDRTDFCQYWATGEVLDTNIEYGSSIMFSEYPTVINNSYEECFYGIFSYESLKNNEKSLIKTIEAHIIVCVLIF